MKDLVYFFHLSRPLNVLITLLAFGLGAFLGMENDLAFVEDPNFWIGMGVLAVISATGYWVNDAFDFKIDRVNKPRKVIVNAHLSVKKVLTAYFTALVLVLGLSFFFQELPLFLVNFAAAALLFAYAALLKRTTVIGNVVIAALTGLVLYYAGLHYKLTLPLMWTILFAFEVTFLREVVKDIEDIEGDLKFKLQTLPIRIGIRNAKRVLYVAAAFFWLSCFGPFVQNYLLFGEWNWIYLAAVSVLVQAPLFYLIGLLRKATEPEHFTLPSRILKLLIINGMISVLFL